MSSLDLTRDWLQNVLRAYPSKDVIIPQVLSILKTRRSLAVKTDAFTFDTGQTALLLLLHGTLPISFRGATYHIPIHIWIPHEYPRDPPLAFVVPTKEMGVRKGREIDPSGRLKEDVVETWWRSWQDKSIEMLLKQLTSVFEVVPPVYARPPEQQTQAGPSRPAGQPGGPMANQGAGPSTQSPPPPPARPGPGPPMPQQRESLPQYRPAPTPPGSSYQPQIPQSHSRQSSMQYQQSPASPSHSGPPRPGPPQSPPVPQRPQQMPPRQGSLPPSSPSGPTIPQRPYIPQYPGHAYDPNTQRAMTPPRQAPPPHQPVYSPAPVQPGYAPDPRMAQQQPSQQPPALHPQHQIHQYPQQYPLNGYAPSPPPAPKIAAPVPPAQQRPAVQDLMSSPEQATTSLPDTEPTATSPPPLPPSKPPPPSLLHLHSILLPHLNASLPPLITSLQATRQHLIERHEDLSSGEPAIKDEMARLEAVKKVCDAVGKRMEDAVAKGEERVADLEQRGEISVDEVVCGISIVHNQLIDLVAEDNAIEDTIYHMTRALDNERIDLDRFLKAIRMLGREQYMKRALIERILQGMGQTW